MEGYPVTLNLYDLSGGLAKNMSRAIIGQQIDGIWHTGIVVYGIVKISFKLSKILKEYYFGGGICNGPPARTPYGNPIQNIPLGTTQIPKDLFLDFLREISPKFTVQTYDLFKNNCNNFTDECAHFLLGNGIPSHIVNLPLNVLKTPMGQMIGNMVSGMQNQANAQSHPMFDPRAMEGQNNPQAMNFGSQSGSNPYAGASKVVTELTGNADYTQAVTGNDFVVIDVFTTWCGPCNAIKLFYASLPAKYPGIRFFKVIISFLYYS